jgi:hypothetical protein
MRTNAEQLDDSRMPELLLNEPACDIGCHDCAMARAIIHHQGGAA